MLGKDERMVSKVVCVHDWWDMTILRGVAMLWDKPYYFECLFDDEADDWSEVYHLTLFTDEIFRLEKTNWDYWLYWLTQSKMPHPLKYQELRKTKEIEEIKTETEDAGEWNKLEIYYRNQIMIDDYLKRSTPVFRAKGIFRGEINGMDTTVEWHDISRI